MDIVGDLMKVAVSGDNLTALSKSMGIADKAKAQSILRVSLPVVLGTMATAAAKPGGAEMLSKLATQAGSTNPIDNLGGFLSSPTTAGGSAMVSALFGSQLDTIQNVIAQKSGLPPATIGKVMGVDCSYGSRADMGKQNISPAGLAQQSKMAFQASPEADTLFKNLMAIK